VIFSFFSRASFKKQLFLSCHILKGCYILAANESMPVKNCYAFIAEENEQRISLHVLISKNFS